MANEPLPSSQGDFLNHVRATLDRIGPRAWRFLDHRNNRVDVLFVHTRKVAGIWQADSGQWCVSSEDNALAVLLTNVLNGLKRNDAGEVG